MSTSDRAQEISASATREPAVARGNRVDEALVKAPPFVDGKLAKWIVIVSGLVPGALLAWDAYRGNLGVNEVNFAIRTTGMVGLVFMTLSLVITPLRRLTGWNWLLSARRNLGVYGFLYIAAHFAIFFLYDRDGSVGSTLSEIVERVYLWFGAGSLALMIPLAITSTDAMVTRVGPKRWKLLHRLAYVAVLFGVIHFYLLEKADKTRPIAFAVVFGGLMVFRIGRHYLDLVGEVKLGKAKLAAAKQAAPKKPKFWRGTLKVARIFDETHDVKTFRMVNPAGGALPFEHVAGQYINLALVIDGKRVNRSYTMASSPTRNQYVEISVKRDGLASKWLHEHLKEGMTLEVGAPAGKFYFAGAESKQVILVAGGVGITPMMSVVRSLTDRCWPGHIYLIFSVRKREDVIFERELEYLQQRFPNLHVKLVFTSEEGRLTKQHIASFVPDLTHGRAMLCGPTPMMVAARALLRELGVPNEEIHEEAFASPPAVDDKAATTPIATAVEAPTGEAPNVQFRRAGKSLETTNGLTVLEAAEECDVGIPFECRSGICGQCKTKLVSGRVTMDVEDALTPGDKAKGLILACQARPVRNVIVDA
jgi:ferredoxin-NADP reductase/DMSO/TMAO reductase YedYZ heme-binding membrane subunit